MFGLCWHNWTPWSEPFLGTWIRYYDNTSYSVLTQKRTCAKCGRIRYRKC